MRPPARCWPIITTNGTGPNNAILVVVGDVDLDATITAVKSIYGAIPKRAVPPASTVALQPVKAESFTLDSNLPYTLAFLAYRFPGTDSPDYAACKILADALASQRGNLYALVPQGKALAASLHWLNCTPRPAWATRWEPCLRARIRLRSFPKYAGSSRII